MGCQATGTVQNLGGGGGGGGTSYKRLMGMCLQVSETSKDLFTYLGRLLPVIVRLINFRL